MSKSACNFVKYFVSSQLSSGHCLFEKLGMLETSFNRSGLLCLCCCSERPHAHTSVPKLFSWSSSNPAAGAKTTQLRKTSKVNIEIKKHLTHLEVENTIYDVKWKKGQWRLGLKTDGNWKRETGRECCGWQRTVIMWAKCPGLGTGKTGRRWQDRWKISTRRHHWNHLAK